MILSFENAIKAKYYLELNGKKTFAGVLLDYWDRAPAPGKNSISHTLKAEATEEQYLTEISELMPLLEINHTTMDEYTRNFFELQLKRLRHNKKLKETTIERYRLNVKRIYQAGVDAGLYESRILWDDLEAKHAQKGTEKNRCDRLRLKKSLDYNQEVNAVKWFLSLKPEEACGDEIGIAIMLFTGLRPGEVCGLTFEDIRKTEAGYTAAHILRSVEAGTKTLQIGGKTSNMFRVVPIPSFLASFIEKREEFVLDEINRQCEGKTNVKNLPIACQSDFKSTLAATNLTDRGKGVLEKIFEAEFQKIYDAVKHDFIENLQEISISEKDPTSYIFRRNYVTMISNLGYTQSEIEFLIGHKISQPGYYRHFFNTETEIERLCEIMQKSTLNLIYSMIEQNGNAQENEKNNTSLKLSIKEETDIHLICNEPMDKVAIKTAIGERVDVLYNISYVGFPSGFSEKPNIADKVLDVYRSRLGGLSKNNE